MVDPIKTHEAGEPSRRHTNVGGRFPSYSQHRARKIAREGRGELFAEVMEATRQVREMERTTSYTAPLPRHVITAQDVTRGLGLDTIAEQKILKALDSSLEGGPTKRTQVGRLAKARQSLIGLMRSMEVHSDVRGEVSKRAMVYWKRHYRTDTGRTPKVRARTFKSENPRLIIRRSTLRKADKGEMAGQHDYESRKPDGRGGWLYKYAGDSDFRAGAGKEEGTTHPDHAEGGAVGAHEAGFQHTEEHQADGSIEHHFGEGVSAHISHEMTSEDHRGAHEEHRANAKNLKKTNPEKSAAHMQAANAHARAHKALVTQEKAAAKKAAQGDAGPGSEAGTKPAAGGKPQGGAGGPPGKGGPPGGAGGAGAQQGPPGAQQGPPQQQGPGAAGDGSFSPPSGSEPGGAGAPDQQYEGAPARASNIPQSEDVRQMREHLGAITRVMTDIMSANAHASDIEQKMRETKKADMPRKHKKMVLAQLKAEHSAAKLDMAHLEGAHDEAMGKLKELQRTTKLNAIKNHPIIKGLLALLDKLGLGGEDDAETKSAKAEAEHEGLVSDIEGMEKKGKLAPGSGAKARAGKDETDKTIADMKAGKKGADHPKMKAAAEDSDGDNIPDGLDKNPKKAGGKADAKGNAARNAKKKGQRQKKQRAAANEKDYQAKQQAAAEKKMGRKAKKKARRRSRARKSYGTPEFVKAIRLANHAHGELRKAMPITKFIYTPPTSRTHRLEW